MVLDGNSFQEYPVNGGVPQRSILGPKLFLLYERVLEVAKLAYATKTKQIITFQKLGPRDFWQIANSVLSKGKSAILPLLNSPEVMMVQGLT